MLKGGQVNGFHSVRDCRRIPINVINKGYGGRALGVPGRDTDADTLIYRMSNLGKGRDQLIYNCIVNMKADMGIKSLTDVFDCLWVFAADSQTNAFLNWAQPQYDLSLVNSATFTPNVGIACISTGYLTTGYDPLGTGGCNFTYGSGSGGVYCNAGTSNNFNVYDMGWANSTDAGFTISCRNTNGAARFACLGPFISPPFNTNNATNGWLGQHSIRRYNQTTMDHMINGRLQQSFNNVGITTGDAGPWIIGGVNQFNPGNGITTPNLFSGRQFAYAFAGGSAIDHAVVYRHMLEYLTVLGAAVQ